MDESVIKHLEQPQVGTLKLSEAIRKGKPLVGEEEVDYVLCAIGCAFAGVIGRRATWNDYAKMVQPNLPLAAGIGQALGFDPDICQRVSTMHCQGWPALMIADWLEEQGY